MIAHAARGLVVAGGVVSAVAIGLIMVVMMIEVVARYIVGSPTSWALEMVSYLLVTAACLGAAYTLQGHAHIAVDVLRRKFPPVVQLALYRVCTLIVLCVAVVMLGWGAIDVHGSWQLGDISLTPMAMPMWIPQLAVPIGGFLLVLQAFLLLGSPLPTDPDARPRAHEA